MRPRVFPAEDPRPPDEAAGWVNSFNEAAGIPRGRLSGDYAGMNFSQALQ